MSQKQKDAAVAQSVVRRIGSAEGFRFFYSLLAIHSSCAIMITVWTGT